jgi:APA family basic amino acid/polyamine antiporter
VGGRKSTAMGLQRELGLASLTSIVVANMIGAGALTLTGFLLAELRAPLAMLALWIVGGGVALCGAVCYGRLGAALPMAGGEAVYLSRLVHPLAGFLSGWVSFLVGFSAPIAASALASAEYAARAFPSLAAGPVAIKLAAIGLIVLGTLAHCRGIGPGARVQNALTLLKVAGIVLFVAAGFALGDGSFAHLFPGPAPAFGRWRSMGLGLLWIMFAYSGWNASAYVGSEARRPRRNLPRSLLLGTAAVTLLYLALNLLFVYAVPAAEMAGHPSPGGLAAARLFGSPSGRAVSAFLALALLSSLSAYAMLGPRICFALARDGLFFRFAARVHPASRVPTRSILFQGAFAVVLVLAGSFDQLLTYLGFALGVFPMLAVMGMFRLPPPQRRGAGPAAILFVLASAVMLGLTLLERPRESLVAMATLLLGVPAYLAARRRQRAGGAEGDSHERRGAGRVCKRADARDGRRATSS